MKKILLSLTLGVAGLLSITSCDSFLDVNPDNRLRLDNYDKIEELITNAYPSGSNIFTEWMSDNVGADGKQVPNRVCSQTYLWEKVDAEHQDTPAYYWQKCYYAIAQANQALKALSELKGEKDDEKEKAIKGEAAACRAYSHFMLLNLFAEPYDPATAATKLGIVNMTTPETKLIQEYKRATLKESYDFVEKDLQTALEMVNDSHYKNSGKYHFTHNAVLALASRFYLYKKDYANAEKYATLLIGTGESPYYLRDYQKVYMATNPNEIGKNYTSPKEVSNILLMKKEVYFAYADYLGYRMNQEVLDQVLLSKNDVRFKATYSYGTGGKSYFIPKVDRSLREQASATASTYMPYAIEVALRGEEVLFNRAEALIMLGENNLPAIKKQLDLYFANVYKEPKIHITTDLLMRVYKEQLFKNDPSVTDTKVLLRLILDERRREFMGEGMRWFDIRRYNIPVIHVDNDGKTHLMTENDNRKTIQLPESAIKVAELVPNNVSTDSPSPVLVQPTFKPTISIYE